MMLKIKDVRRKKSKDFTQKYMADKLKIPVTTYASKEQSNNFTSSEIQIIGKILDYDFSGITNVKKAGVNFNKIERDSVRKFVDADINRRVALILNRNPIMAATENNVAPVPDTIEALQYQVEYLSDQLASYKAKLERADELIAELRENNIFIKSLLQKNKT